MEKDLTRGPVFRQLACFALPLLAANLLQSFYSMADMAVVGRWMGATGLAAVSNAAMLCFILSAAGLGMAVGGTVLIAQAKGAGDAEGQREVAGTLLVAAFLGSVLVTALSLAVSRTVLVWMGVTEEVMPEAVAYMQVVSLGMPFFFGVSAVSAILRGLGDSRRPLWFAAVAAVVNIGLDVVLVAGLGWGTAGAAWATVISQFVSLAVSLPSLRGLSFGLGWKDVRLYPGRVGALLRISVPSALQLGVVNLSYLLVTGMLNGYGVAVAAAAGIGLKVNTFAAMPCWAFGQAVSAMVGQNLGAGRLDRVRQTVKQGIRLGLLVTFGMMAAIQIWVEPFMELFSRDPDVVAVGVWYLRVCCSVNFAFYVVMYTMDSFATGMGDAAFAMANAIFHSVIMRLTLSVALAWGLGFGYLGIFIGESLSPALPMLAGILYYRRRIRREKLNQD